MFSIRVPPTITTEKYDIHALQSATGVLYITKRSPYFISGHVRMLGKNHGQYPYKYKEMINEVFGQTEDEIEVCSGSVEKSDNLVTVDINPETNCSYVMDAQALNVAKTFTRWYCDPPYNGKTASKMYGVKMPSISKLLSEGARVVKPGSLLFMLLGATNMQWVPLSLTRIGWICITIVPLQEIRALHVYYRF